MAKVLMPPAHLHPHPPLGDDFLDYLEVGGQSACPTHLRVQGRAVQVNQVQPLRPRFAPAQGNGGGVVGVDGLFFVVPLVEPHTSPGLQVNGWNYLHGLFSSPIAAFTCTGGSAMRTSPALQLLALEPREIGAIPVGPEDGVGPSPTLMGTKDGVYVLPNYLALSG